MEGEFRDGFRPLMFLAAGIGVIVIAGYLLVASVVPEIGKFNVLPDADGGNAGLVVGFIHGALVLVSAFAAGSSADAVIYQAQDGTSWYALGYVLGVASVGLPIAKWIVQSLWGFAIGIIVLPLLTKFGFTER